MGRVDTADRMGLYARCILPGLTHLAMRGTRTARERARIVPRASGAVLELGIGSALNVPYYGPDVESLHGVDPSAALWRLGRARVARAPFPIEFIAGSAERLPLADASIDTAVSTWTLCTIPDPHRALAEVRRVLRPGGRLLFVEHGAAPDARVRAWQDRLTPAWRRLAGNCHLNRPIDRLIEGAGFTIVELDGSYTGPVKVVSYFYRGVARPDPGSLAAS
jgi:ubiquinone/menaquinone biosynthesis C-methylase UbiE